MIYFFLAVAPILIGLVFLGRRSRKVIKYYRDKQPALWKDLNVVDNSPKTKYGWFIAQWVPPAPSTYIDPVTKIACPLFDLPKDLDFAKKTNDQKLMKLVKLRLRVWQYIIFYIAVAPMLGVAYLGYVLL